MKHETKIEISFNDLSAWQDFLDGKGDGTLNCVKTFTAEYGDCGEGSISIDIKVCEGGKDSTPFIDAVMFQDGNDVGCLEVRDTLAGEYVFQNYLKDTYVVIIPDSIEAAKGGQKKYREVEKWLRSLDDARLRSIDDELKSSNLTIDRGFTIETILEHCAGDDDVLDKLYGSSVDVDI